MGSRVADRHCGCKDALTDLLLASIRNAGNPEALRSFAKVLAKNRGHTLASCPGTHLPEIDWEAMKPVLLRRLRQEIAQGTEVYEALADYQSPVGKDPSRAFDACLERAVNGLVQGVHRMWDVTLQGQVPPGATVRH